MRRIWLDGDEILLKQIMFLWRELPSDLRPNEGEIQASTVIFEAIEFIKLLRKQLDIHDVADRITELDDLYDDRVRERPTIPPLPQPTSKTNVIFSGSPQVIGIQAPPSTSQVAAMQPRMALVNGKLIQLTTPSSTLHQPVINNQIRLMNPSNAVTVTPVGNPIMPEQTVIRPGAANLKITGVSSLKDNSSDALTAEVVKARMLQAQLVKHGPHCTATCPCKEDDSIVPSNLYTFLTTEQYKAVMTALMKPTASDVDKQVHDPEFKRLLFYAIFDVCSYNVKKLRKFLLSAGAKNGANIDSRFCVLISKKSWLSDDRKGAINIRGTIHMLPQVLYKMFRENTSDYFIQSLTLMSTDKCLISNPDVTFDRNCSMCVNPFHYRNISRDFFKDKTNVVEHKHVYRMIVDSMRGAEIRCESCLGKYDARAPCVAPSDAIYAKVQSDSNSAAKRARLESQDEGFPCWRCLKWLPNRKRMVHSCLKELCHKGLMLYTCRFCGVCFKSVQAVDQHVLDKCGLLDIPMLDMYVNGPAPSEGIKCDKCNVQFSTDTEFQLHQDQSVCFHVACRYCAENLASTQSYQVHNCYERVCGLSYSKHVALYDVSTITNPCMRPVKCVDCCNIFQTFGLLKRHKNFLKKTKIDVKCVNCKNNYESQCEYFQHDCPITGNITLSAL